MSASEEERIPASLAGQKYAFATASLLLGIASFVHFLGLEKAALAIAFGILALRKPAATRRRSWAIVGIVMGCATFLIVGIALALFHDRLAELVEHLKQFG